jgi:hypothetical protein
MLWLLVRNVGCASYNNLGVRGRHMNGRGGNLTLCRTTCSLPIGLSLKRGLTPFGSEGIRKALPSRCQFINTEASTIDLPLQWSFDTNALMRRNLSDGVASFRRIPSPTYSHTCYSSLGIRQRLHRVTQKLNIWSDGS